MNPAVDMTPMSIGMAPSPDMRRRPTTATTVLPTKPQIRCATRMRRSTLPGVDVLPRKCRESATGTAAEATDKPLMMLGALNSDSKNSATRAEACIGAQMRPTVARRIDIRRRYYIDIVMQSVVRLISVDPVRAPQRTAPYRSPTGISTATVLPGCARGQAQAGS
jgi:hypothetical protein